MSGWDADSLTKRVDLIGAAGLMLRQSPVFGVGLGNFTVSLAKLGWKNFGWQPVHNIFLLVLAELGLAGFAVVLLVIKSCKYRFSGKRLAFFLFVLLTGLVDHYWISLGQNQWLLVMAILAL